MAFLLPYFKSLPVTGILSKLGKQAHLQYSEYTFGGNWVTNFANFVYFPPNTSVGQMIISHHPANKRYKQHCSLTEYISWCFKIKSRVIHQSLEHRSSINFTHSESDIFLLHSSSTSPYMSAVSWNQHKAAGMTVPERWAQYFALALIRMKFSNSPLPSISPAHNSNYSPWDTYSW